MNNNVIGVIGAGTMGVGIAHDFADYGYLVKIMDSAQKALDKFHTLLEQSYKTQCLLGKPRSSIEEIKQRIQISASLNLLQYSDFIIENTTESTKQKKQILKAVNEIAKPNCIIAINTSCIPITSLCQSIDRPERMLGIHFMNPVPIKPFVEIIKTTFTSEHTLSAVTELLQSIGKGGNVVNDSPGFVINRVFMVTVNEAIKTFEENLCQLPAQIDQLFVKCLGHRMGPLMTADLIGLDTILYSLNVLHDEFKSDLYLPAKLLIKLVNQGKLGRKSGEGLYHYVTTEIATHN